MARAKDKHTLYFETLEALQAGHCPPCLLGRRGAELYIDALIYENVNNPTTRERTRRAQGLCRAHAWYMREHGGVPGMFLVYRDVVRDVAVALGGDDPRPPVTPGLISRVRRLLRRRRPLPAAAQVRAALEPTGTCPACEAQQQAEFIYLNVLLENLHDPKVAEAMSTGQGLCLGHLRMALDMAPDEATLSRLIEVHRQLYGQALADLDELIARLDFYRFQDAGGTGDVSGAGTKALTLIAGEKGLT